MVTYIVGNKISTTIEGSDPKPSSQVTTKITLLSCLERRSQNETQVKTGVLFNYCVRSSIEKWELSNCFFLEESTVHPNPRITC